MCECPDEMTADDGRQTMDDRPPGADEAGSRFAVDVSRRAFLRGLLAAAGGTALAACGVEGEVQQVRPIGRDYNTATPNKVLQSPQARPGAGTPEPGTPEPVEGGLGLESFLALSAVLTGVSNLDPVVGRIYLQALQAGDFQVSLADLYERAGFGPDTAPALDEVEQAGIFDDEATRTLADTIIRYWYTGVYDTAEGEQAVATFVDALAWKALPWTKPNSICGSPGFWEERPDVVLPFDPNPRPTPTPTASQAGASISRVFDLQSTHLRSPITTKEQP